MGRRNNILSGTRIFTAIGAKGSAIFLLYIAVLVTYGYVRWGARPNLSAHYSTPPNFERAATLRILDKSHYEFCYKRCEKGVFQLWPVSKNEDWRLIFHGALIEQYYRQLSEDQDGHAMMMRMSGPPTGQYVAIVEATYWGKSRILLDALREIYLEPVE